MMGRSGLRGGGRALLSSYVRVRAVVDRRGPHPVATSQPPPPSDRPLPHRPCTDPQVRVRGQGVPGAGAHHPVPRLVAGRRGRVPDEPRLARAVLERTGALRGGAALPQGHEREPRQVAGLHARLHQRAHRLRDGRGGGRRRLQPAQQVRGGDPALLPGWWGRRALAWDLYVCVCVSAVPLSNPTP